MRFKYFSTLSEGDKLRGFIVMPKEEKDKYPTGVIDSRKEDKRLMLMENPIGETLNLRLSLDHPAKVQLCMMDMNGVVCWREMLPLNQGTTTICGKVGLPRGCYLLCAMVDGEKYYEMVVVK